MDASRGHQRPSGAHPVGGWADGGGDGGGGVGEALGAQELVENVGDLGLGLGLDGLDQLVARLLLCTPRARRPPGRRQIIDVYLRNAQSSKNGILIISAA